jgi:DDE family transposase
VLAALPVKEMELTLYGKAQSVRLRSVIAVVRFLKGLPVRVVWCEMRQADNTWSRPRLILATETHLSAQAVMETYAERWGIEPLFHNLKRWWGVTNLWQQSKPALELWMQIRSTAYALTQLLALRLWESFPMMDIAPWRQGAMITAGLFGQWLRIQFIGLRVRDACNPKSGHFVMPFPGQDQRLQC